MKHQSTTSFRFSLTRGMLMLSLGLGLAVTASAGEGPLVYVVTINQDFGTVNLASGAFHRIASTPMGLANLVPAPGGLFYSLVSFGDSTGDSTGDLVTIDPSTGATKNVGATGLGSEAFSLAGFGGKLYLTDFSGNLYSIDARTGKATLIIATLIPPDPKVPGTQNPDGTVNFCDESFYGFAGQLYATFDSFTISPTTSLAITPTTNAWIYRIDPVTGVTARVAPTAFNIAASVEVDGTFYAFTQVFTAFTEFGPQAYSKLVTLDQATGATKFLVNVDPTAAAIFGAAPAPRQRGQH